MSRTIRRKNEREMEYDFVDAWYNDYEHEVRAWNVDYTKERKMRLAHFHSDKYNFNAPKNVRVTLGRAFRRKNNEILFHAIRDDNDPVFIPFKKDANWHYF